jgi:hypothetical protein
MILGRNPIEDCGSRRRNLARPSFGIALTAPVMRGPFGYDEQTAPLGAGAAHAFAINVPPLLLAHAEEVIG